MLKNAIVIGTGACTGTAVILDELTKDEFWDKVESYWSGKYIEAAGFKDNNLTRAEGKAAAIGCFGKVLAKTAAYELGSMFTVNAVLEMFNVK